MALKNLSFLKPNKQVQNLGFRFLYFCEILHR